MWLLIAARDCIALWWAWYCDEANIAGEGKLAMLLRWPATEESDECRRGSAYPPRIPSLEGESKACSTVAARNHVRIYDGSIKLIQRCRE